MNGSVRKLAIDTTNACILCLILRDVDIDLFSYQQDLQDYEHLRIGGEFSDYGFSVSMINQTILVVGYTEICKGNIDVGGNGVITEESKLININSYQYCNLLDSVTGFELPYKVKLLAGRDPTTDLSTSMTGVSSLTLILCACYATTGFLRRKRN